MSKAMKQQLEENEGGAATAAAVARTDARLKPPGACLKGVGGERLQPSERPSSSHAPG